MNCAFCNKELEFPFVCNYCHDAFCVEHRLPENHNCLNKPFKVSTPEPEPEFVSEGEFHFERKKAQPTFKETKTKRRLEKWHFVVAAVLAVMIIANVLFWNFSYSNAIQANYDLGFQQGSSYSFADGYRQGNMSGHSIGYAQGLKDAVGTGYNIRDPSYQEMLNFLASDRTNEHVYSENDYNCYDYTNDVCNNAFDAGIRCGSVYIKFVDSAHSIVCFETTDQGLKFVEPQDDRIVTLTIGQKYFDRALYEIDFDDTIVRYKIIW